MEQNMPPVIAKRVWSLVRLMFYMLRKRISKVKFMAEFNMMMKRGKIASKALQNLMFHHHRHVWPTSLFTINRRSPHPNLQYSFPSPPPGEYEFSCSNSPAYPFSLFSFRKKHNNNNNHSDDDQHFFSCTQSPFTDEREMVSIMKALEMLHSVAASPALPGFGKSPMVRQLGVTDSPFPLQGGLELDEDRRVDEAAEEFIIKFYNDLRRQNEKSI